MHIQVEGFFTSRHRTSATQADRTAELATTTNPNPTLTIYICS